MGDLRPGNIIPGLSIIEGTDTTIVVPEDRKIVVDEYQNFLLRYR